MLRGSERVYDTRACVYHKVISSALVYVCPAGRVYVYAGVKVNVVYLRRRTQQRGVCVRTRICIEPMANCILSVIVCTRVCVSP